MKLTTEHAASSYGVPVLVDDNGKAYGPRDIVDGSGVEAWTLVTYATEPADLADKFIAAANLEPGETDQTCGTIDGDIDDLFGR